MRQIYLAAGVFVAMCAITATGLSAPAALRQSASGEPAAAVAVDVYKDAG